MPDAPTLPRTNASPQEPIVLREGVLSFGQELLWLMDRASPGTTVWNVSRAFRLRGPCDATALQRALDALAARHESLRTVFVTSDDGARAIVQESVTVPLRCIDLTALPPSDAETEAMRLVRVAAETPFDMAHEPLLRTLLITLRADDRVFVLDTHHIVSDGWSKGIMLRELSAFYAHFHGGTPLDVPVLPIQFTDYAARERSAAYQATLADDLAYWRERLAGVDPEVRLPLDRPRAAHPTYDAASAVGELPPSLADALTNLAREHRATLYMALLAGFAAVLHRYGTDDVVIGSPSAGRLDDDTEHLIGYFANTLVLRTSFAGDPTFAELLERVRETALDALEHQAVPVEQLVLALQKDGELVPAPLFRVVMTMEDTLPGDLRFAGVHVEPLDSVAATAKFDLTLLVRALGDGLRLNLLYQRDLLSAATAERLLAHLRTLLEAAVLAPEQRVALLPLLTPSELRDLRAASETSPDTEPFVAILGAVAAQAARAPERTAVVCNERRLSYGELLHDARKLGRQLSAAGVRHGAVVGIYLERSVEALVAMLGIWCARAAFVPLPPDAATERLSRRLADAGIATVVTTAGLCSALPPQLGVVLLDDGAVDDFAVDDFAVDDLAAPAEARSRSALPAPDTTAPDDLAYILFTSGSTGAPKGVAVTHGNLTHYTRAISARLGVSAADPWRFASVSTLGADLGYTAIFPALCSGGTVHLVPADIAANSAAFAEYANAQRIDVLKITPSHLGALIGPTENAVSAACLPRRWLVLGGEACSWRLVERVRALGACRVLNHYGPSETTVGATTFAVGEDDPGDTLPATVPIGRPLRGVRAYVLDRNAQQLPIGVAGELVIGGAGVARGYLNRPELTAERFSNDRFAGPEGARMYRSGDRVRRLPSGDLEFLGRFDDQVKIRGYRVELGEIESALAAHPRVARCAVVFRPSDSDQARIDAYVVLRDGDRTTGANASDALRTWLQTRLPEYMLPTSLIALDALPLGPNGKVDAAALPAPRTDAPSDDGHVAPRTPTEASVAEVIAKALGRERVGATENFIALGFQSILAIRALGTLSRRFAIRLPLRVFFERPTVADLASAIDAEVAAVEEHDLVRALELLEASPAAAGPSAST